MTAQDLGGARAGRVARVVRSVCAAALRDSGAHGIVVLEDWTPEGELSYEWLVQELGEARVWRAASLTANVQGGAAGVYGSWRNAPADAPLIAHPANKTALLLGGRLPHADLFPLGDLWASQIDALAGRWSAPAEVEDLARVAGGIGVLDEALVRLVEARHEAAAAVHRLDVHTAGRLLRLYERGRYARRHARLVPKLTARTLGIDLFD
jgi:hypothetical protein